MDRWQNDGHVLPDNNKFPIVRERYHVFKKVQCVKIGYLLTDNPNQQGAADHQSHHQLRG